MNIPLDYADGESGSRLAPVVVITGASSGIGRAFARAAARDRKTVLLVARSGDALGELATEPRALGSQAAWLSLDLGAQDAGEKIESTLAERGQYCAVLVQAAGLGALGPLHSAGPERQLALVEVNVRALTDLALRFLPGMIARRSGGIIIVGSAAGYIPGPNMAVYYATKAYARSLSDALYEESRRSGVTVT